MPKSKLSRHIRSRRGRQKIGLEPEEHWTKDVRHPFRHSEKGDVMSIMIGPIHVAGEGLSLAFPNFECRGARVGLHDPAAALAE